MLAAMVLPTPKAFVARMNATARSLGLHNTHYAMRRRLERFGLHGARSGEARDGSYALATRSSIVDQTQVDLPVAGFVNTFTPLVGENDVVGVKSGRTTAAGGCDVMAVAYR